MTSKRLRLDLTPVEAAALMEHLVRTGTGPDVVSVEPLARVIRKLHDMHQLHTGK